MLTGILLAAGRSRRMGRTKQLLPWPTAAGTRPLVAAAFDSVARVCDSMIVVLGHEAEMVRRALHGRAYDGVLGDPETPMFASLRAGLEAARRCCPKADLLLQPGDHPELRPATLDRLVDAFEQRPEGEPPLAVLPVAEDPSGRSRGGHPVLIPGRLIDQILACDRPGGLRRFWADHPSRCERLPVDDPAVLLDLDTMDDYRRAYALALERLSRLAVGIGAQQDGDPAGLVEVFQNDLYHHRQRNREEHSDRSQDPAPKDQGNEDDEC
jgi:molybdenum cofactor cytidylyltransferase